MIRPAAALTMIVANSFYVLYVPVASRLAARHDLAGSGDLFWRTAIWVAVATFPIFAVSFALGRPIAVSVRERYAELGIYLSILAVGYLINATFEFSGATLTAHRHTRTVALLNLAAAMFGVVATLILVPLAGALGAAVAAAGTLIVQVLLLHLAMGPKVGIPLIHRGAVRVFAIILIATIDLIVVQAVLPFGWWTVAVAAVTSAIVVFLCREALRIDTPFPEVGQALDRVRGMIARGRRTHDARA